MPDNQSVDLSVKERAFSNQVGKSHGNNPKPLPVIPFNRPGTAGNEFAYMRRALEKGHISGNGEFTRECEKILEAETGALRALLTTSCTHALEMSAILSGIGPGEEFVVPSFTFVSTVNAFLLRGGRPRFIDIRPDTLNLDENLLGNLVGPATRAVVPVHYAGVGCEMDAVRAAAERVGALVVEDNAHGFFGKWRGRPLGGLGDLATLSFHETKNITCGEGGALLVNRQEFAERAEIIREKGTDRSRFFRGETDKYTWQDIGSSYVLSDLLAAFLLAQLEDRRGIQAARQKIWERYSRGVAAWAAATGTGLPIVPGHCDCAWHLFYLILPDAGARDRLLARLRERGIHAVFHYLPLHLSPMGKKLGGKPGDCPVTENISGRLLRLPFYPGLEENEQQRVIETILEFEP